jgi:hypothetical protein
VTACPQNYSPRGDDYSFKRLNEVDLGRHSTMRLIAHAGDKVWIGDIGNGIDPHTSLWLKNIEICGSDVTRPRGRPCLPRGDGGYLSLP